MRFSRLPSTERSQHVENGPKSPKATGPATALEIPIIPSEQPAEAIDAEGLKHRNSHGPDEKEQDDDSDSKPAVAEKQLPTTGPGHVSFSTDTFRPREKALRIPGPREFEAGHRAHEVDEEADGETFMRQYPTTIC